jgi:hypothetical protein
MESAGNVSGSDVGQDVFLVANVFAHVTIDVDFQMDFLLACGSLLTLWTVAL